MVASFINKALKKYLLFKFTLNYLPYYFLLIIKYNKKIYNNKTSILLFCILIFKYSPKKNKKYFTKI